jgi:hypothetical protein
MLRARPEDIEYRLRLKWGSVFQYTTEQHSRKNIEEKNYFHNLSQRYLMPGDEIRIAVLHKDGSWSKAIFEVYTSDSTDTVINQIEDWRSSGSSRAKNTKKKKALEPSKAVA